VNLGKVKWADCEKTKYRELLTVQEIVQLQVRHNSIITEQLC